MRHEPYGVLDFRVTIDSLPCDKVAGFGRMFCLKFPFQVYFLKQWRGVLICKKYVLIRQERAALSLWSIGLEVQAFLGFRDVYGSSKGCEEPKRW